MDKKITIRFYTVTRHSENDPELVEVLDHIAGIQNLVDREIFLSQYFGIRLETLAGDGPNAVIGELTRIQTTNYPSEVHANGTRPLPTNSPLGHGVIFRYNHQQGILGFQYDPRVASPSKFIDYLAAIFAGAKYELRPIVRDDGWERFMAGGTRKINITIASPAHLENIEGEGQAAIDAVRSLGEAYEAPVITIEMGMGHKSGALSNAVKATAQAIYDLGAIGGLDLRRMGATAETMDDIPNDEIDLLAEILKESEELTLPDNDPDRSFEVRKNYIRTAMRRNGM